MEIIKGLGLNLQRNLIFGYGKKNWRGEFILCNYDCFPIQKINNTHQSISLKTMSSSWHNLLKFIVNVIFFAG